MSTVFYKMQATGNDFIFFLEKDLKKNLAAADIAALCDRHRGVGADGLVILREISGDIDFKWDFFNADGGRAEMCGNAARCATLLYSQEFKKQSCTFQTQAGVIAGRVTGEKSAEVSFSLPPATIKKMGPLAGGRFQEGYFINTGVPHCVIPVDKPWDLVSSARELAPFIQSSEFGAAGSNLTFVNWKQMPLQAVTLERGVNDFTLSCGTGVIAAAVVYCDLKKQNGETVVITPGGELKVKVALPSPQISLTGPATIVFKGDL